MGISVLSSAPIVPLTSSPPVDVVTTAAAVGAASEAARADHAHKLIDTGWLTPTLLNGWLVYDTTFGNAAMYRKIGNIVFLRGLVKNGTMGTAVFVLPVGYRPAVRCLFGIDSNSAHGRVDVTAAGEVLAQAGSNLYYQISCSFVADG